VAPPSGSDSPCSWVRPPSFSFAGHRASSGSGKSITALVIGALTVITYVSIYVGDYLADH
jgi:hypothetical protein